MFENIKCNKRGLLLYDILVMTFFDPFHIFREIIECDPSYIECESSIDRHPYDIRKRIFDDDEKFFDSETEIQEWSKYEDTKVPPHIMVDMSFSDTTDKMWDSFLHII